MEELAGAALSLDRRHAGARAFVLASGKSRAFSAGVDVREMAATGRADAAAGRLAAAWAEHARLRKPLVAAVEGAALGGGCELALMADVVFAS
jgi:enoyl-CoA hydratase/carnithine racemase